MGEVEDSCNDLCQFKGYTGCDAEKTGGLVRQPKMSRVMDFLNTSCAEFGTSPLNNLFPAYTGSNQRCWYMSGSLDCDRAQYPYQPVCRCSGTTSTTTLSVAWLQHSPVLVL